MTSMLKFANRTDGGGGRRLYWGRAVQDGAPYRGQAPPQLTQEEFEEKTVRIFDAKNGTFNTGNKEENAEYLSVLDLIANRMAGQVYIRRWRPKDAKHMVVYIEWVEYYLEDGTPTQGVIGHGQPQVAGIA